MLENVYSAFFTDASWVISFWGAPIILGIEF